jgi:acyl-[acyl-carrier-protein]-phospholipid O-acyltransferase/long-chain-fatty-acid--[acyl-carrier-protein] ligase
MSAQERLLERFGRTTLKYLVFLAVIALMVKVGIESLGPYGLSVLLIFTGTLVLSKKVSQWLCQKALKRLFRVEIKGLENYELAGENTVIMANYSTRLDLLLLSLFLPGKMVVATQQGKGFWAKLMLMFVDVIPINPLSTNTPRVLIKALQEGKRCIVFPEKTFAEHRSSLSAFEGVGLIIDKTDAHILPIHISGTSALPFARKGSHVKKNILPKVVIEIKKPQLFTVPLEYSARQRRQFYAQKIYEVLQIIHLASAKLERTVFEALLDARDYAGGKFVLCEDVQRTPLNYNDLVVRSFLLGELIAKQTAKKAYVGLMLPTTATALVSFMALQAFGRVPAMLNFSQGAKGVFKACQTADIKVVYTSQQFIETAKLEPLVMYLKEQGVIVHYLESFKKDVHLKEKLQALLKSKVARLMYKQTSDNAKYYQPAAVLFTSGSEGTPKGVVLSHKNLLANCAQLTESVDFTMQDKIFSALPIFHCFGLTVGAILPAVHAVPCFFYPSPLHYRIIPNLLEETKSTIMLGTDTFLNGYAKYAKPGQFRHVRYLFAGAEKLKETTREYWATHLGVCISQGYGATEASPVISTNTTMKQKHGSVGCLLPEIESRLEPVSGIQHGGKLWIKGPNIMMGYIQAKKPGVLQPLCDGWYDTGDVVDIDAEGYVSIVGRLKRFAKVGGEMVSLAFVEEFANRIWPAGVHAAVSMPDEKKGEKVILMTDVPEASREQLIRVAKEEGIAEIMLPKRIIALKEMPVLVSGKIDYSTLNQEVRESA